MLSKAATASDDDDEKKECERENLSKRKKEKSSSRCAPRCSVGSVRFDDPFAVRDGARDGPM